jgi:thiol-disulfide isomerase/thioredoxin
MFFKMTDFKGKVILVETMAVWCPKCLTQQQEIAKLKTSFADRDDFVSIGIDIDPNENEALLASHVTKYGFDWTFTIASKSVIDEISALYGAQFLNPTATPMLIIDKQGNQHLLPFGIKTAQELQKAVQPFLDAE